MSQSLRGRLFRLSPHLFGTEVKLNEFLDDYVSCSKVVILGEFHGESSIIELQTLIQKKLADSLLKPIQISNGNSNLSSFGTINQLSTVSCDSDSNKNNMRTITASPKVRVVMEHFSLEMQQILDLYQGGTLDLFGLKEAYKSVGTEGHALEPYFPALEAARLDPLQRFHIQGGFIPRTYARLLMREGIDSALTAAVKSGYISPNETLQGTDAHYNFFEGLLTGRDIHDQTTAKFITDRFRSKMFPAQILKDASMAYTVRNILENKEINADDKILVVCGVGHMLYSHGVPERIFDRNSLKENKTLRVACLPLSTQTNSQNEGYKVNAMSSDEIAQILKSEYGGPETDAADVCFLYFEDDDDSPIETNEKRDSDEKIREETKAAYDKVGSTAHLVGGDLIKARKMMHSLGYTSEEIDVLGNDAVNYQGVGCPHRHIALQKGEHVLDMGSGLGIDSILSRYHVGKEGKVVGIDLSSDCVDHANKRANQRGLNSNLSFKQASLEDLSAAFQHDNLFDAIISNGAFCLAPNKKAGFSECHRVLKPGGRIAICTTVLKTQLKHEFNWPLCMQTFAKLDEIVPILTELGFVEIEIDMSDSKMEVEIDDDDDEEEEDGNDNLESSNESKLNEDEEDTGRYKVHNEEGRKEFRHLENVDMNALCARVVIKAKKRSE